MIRKYLNLCSCQHSQCGYLLVRQLSTLGNEVPVIRIPKYLEKGLGNAVFKEHRKVKKAATVKNKVNLDPKHSNKLIISWKGDKKINHYYGYRYDPNNVPLISKLWIKQDSVGMSSNYPCILY